MSLHRFVDRVGENASLDAVAEPLGRVVKRLVPPKTAVKDALSGSWLGHPLHPLLTDIPIGSLTSTTVLDLIGGQGARRAADRLLTLGLAASVVTAAAGAADWSDTNGSERRIGVVHAVANVVGIGCYAASAIARRRGRRGAGATLGLVGLGAMSAGGYLGGDLSYARGVGVNNAFVEHPPTEWVDVGDETLLADAGTVRVDADAASVLLYRRGPQILAIGSRCSHAGGPLEDGDIDPDACTVTCPWHQSEFRLDTGSVVHGPATTPQTSYEARIVDGRIEIRAAES